MFSIFGTLLCLVFLDCKVINLLSVMNFNIFSSLHLKTVYLASICNFSILVLLLFTFFEISVFWCAIVAFWSIHPTEWLELSITFLIFQVKVSIIIFLFLWLLIYFFFITTLLNFLTYKHYYLLTTKKIYSYLLIIVSL